MKKMMYKKDLLKTILSKKKYPANTPLDDFMKITNGVPIFVNMIPDWEQSFNFFTPKIPLHIEKKKKIKNI